MPAPLLSRLDAAYAKNPDPDAIQRTFQPKGWIPCKGMTREQHAVLHDRYAALVTHNEGTTRPWYLVQSQRWRFWFDHEFTTGGDWDNAYVIPIEEFEDGVWPSL